MTFKTNLFLLLSLGAASASCARESTVPKTVATKTVATKTEVETQSVAKDIAKQDAAATQAGLDKVRKVLDEAAAAAAKDPTAAAKEPGTATPSTDLLKVTGPPVLSSRELVPGAGKLFATFETSMGKISVELLEKDAPLTVANFVGLALGKVAFRDPAGKVVKRPLYDGTLFHRVIPRFMIQGGDPAGNGTGGPGYTFRDEHSSLTFDRPGLLAMANSGPNTNGSQFFLTEVPTPHLNGHHTIFGKVVSGERLIAKIARVERGPGSRPLQPVTLQHVKIKRGQAATP